jgi:hypothetical protein
MKKIARGTARIARLTTTVVGLAIMLALMFGVATTALAGTGVGAPFNLGKLNTVNKMSTLVGSVAKPMLRVDNNGSGPALNLEVQPGQAPLTVSPGAGVATGLRAEAADVADHAQSAGTASDADKLDGKDSSSFASATHTHSAADINDGPGSGLDADTVDGKDSSQLKGATAYARVTVHPSDPTPTLDLSRTSGFTAVSRSSTGSYCLTPAGGIDPATRPAVVSVDWQSTSSPEGNATASYNAFGCGNGRFQVETERQSVSNGVLVEQGANDIGFVIVVP